MRNSINSKKDEHDDLDRELQDEESSKAKPPEDDEDEDLTRQFDNAADMFKAAGFSHFYDSRTDTLNVRYGARVLSLASDSPVGEEENLAKGAFGSKAGNAPDFHPTDEEYKIISKLNNKKYSPEAFKVYYTLSSGSDYDRHMERMGKKALQKMVDQAYDTPMLMDHNYYSSNGVFGKIFEGKVFRSSDGTQRVVHKFFMMNSPENKSIIEGFESGINNKLSVGVRMRRKDYLCDICDKPMFMMDENQRYQWCGHMVGMELKDGRTVTATISDLIELLELSRVTVPAYKAAAVKSLEIDKAKSLGIAEPDHVKTASVEGSAVGDRILATAKISQEVSKGDSAVDLDKTGENSGQLADSAVADNSSKSAEGTTQDASDIVKVYTDAVALLTQVQSKCIEAMSEQKAISSKIEEGLAKLISLSEKQGEKQAEEKKSLAEEMSKKEAHFEKQLAESRELLLFQVKALTKFAEDCGMVVQKSTIEIARDVNNSLSMKQTAANAEQGKAGEDNFYETATSKFQRPNNGR